MLIIKKSQIEQLGAHLRDRYVRTMLAHVKAQFPDRCVIYGDDRVRELILEGVKKAEGFGIVSEQDAGGVIHFMFAAEPDFDRRPEYQWAVDALKSPGLEPTERVDLLYAKWRDHPAPGGRR
jgi:hypothetical protein